MGATRRDRPRAPGFAQRLVVVGAPRGDVGSGEFAAARLAVPPRGAGLSGGIESHSTNSCRALYHKNTGDLPCAEVINHAPVASVSPVIFSQYLSICFCIKHEAKQQVGSSFSSFL